MKKKKTYLYILAGDAAAFCWLYRRNFVNLIPTSRGITDDDLLIDDNGSVFVWGLSSKASTLTTISVKARTGLSS